MQITTEMFLLERRKTLALAIPFLFTFQPLLLAILALLGPGTSSAVTARGPGTRARPGRPPGTPIPVPGTRT